MAQRKLAVIVTGGRTFGHSKRHDSATRKREAEAERQAAYAALDAASPEVVLHGDCPTGADAVAKDWCTENHVWYVGYPADWSRGKSAGPMRNGVMCDDLLKYRPDGYRIGVIAFPGGDGTASCINHAGRRGIKVWQPAEAGEVRFDTAPAMAEELEPGVV